MWPYWSLHMTDWSWKWVRHGRIGRNMLNIPQSVYETKGAYRATT